MLDRQRFHAVMNYQARDRAPLYDFSFWDETLPLWHQQGLPLSVNRANASSFFGMDRSIGSGEDTPASVPGRISLLPTFPSGVIEDRGDHEVVQQGDGVRVLRRKHMSSIPTHEGHLLTDRASWREHYLPRLNPDNPDRFPPGWDDHLPQWRDAGRADLAILPCGSLYGWLRNWMGLEHISLVVYDDPALFEEMVETLAECTLSVLRRILATGGTFDAGAFWEDMCGNAGPLLSPAHFKQYLVPRYRRIIDLLHKHGVHVAWVDCDGKIDHLLPLWLDVGVNCMFPIEIGSWNADPIAMRRQYGRDLLMMGGFDKRILAAGPEAIDREIERLTPLVEEGGFIPFCDHRVPPDVTLSNYMHYVRTARRVWGRDTNLRPMAADQPELVNS